MKPLLKLLPLFPYLFVFLFSIYVPTDPDLGWHLKNGEYFFNNGQPIRENIYSALMPGYQWANTSWLTDIITYSVFSIGGFPGLSILGGIVVALTFYFFSKAARLSMWDQVFLFPLILYLTQPLNSVSFRGQQISLLFIGILFYILSLYPQNKKYLYLTAPLFILWANLHGQFILGLALFGLWILLYVLKNILLNNLSSYKFRQLLRNPFDRITRKEINELLFLVGMWLLCLVGTFINPFGWGIHLAAVSHIGSPLLQYIAEYLPFEMLSTAWWNQVMAGVLLIFGFLSLLLKNKFLNNLPLLGSGMLLFLLSFEIRRYAWPAYYMILPLLVPLSVYLQPDKKKVTNMLAGIFAVILVIMAFVSKFPLEQFSTYNWQTYCEKMQCSPKAVAYMIDNDLTQNPYTLYGWGGWLIWNYPEVKPVIDGRMHLWNQNGYSAFEEYYAIEQNFKDINETDYNTVLISPEKPLHERLIKLENAGKWKMVYNDKNASVFVRK